MTIIDISKTKRNYKIKGKLAEDFAKMHFVRERKKKVLISKQIIPDNYLIPNELGRNFKKQILCT